MSALSAQTDSVNANRLWVSVGKPRSGPIFSHRQSTRRAYRSELHSNQEYYKNYYSDALHDSLMQKDGSSFWKCWRSKFDSRPANFSVCGSVNNVFVCNKFYDYFRSIVIPNSPIRDLALHNEFDRCYAEFCRHDCRFDDIFDIDVISDAISGLKRGKAVGPDGISAEHLHFSHPVLSSILLRLFNLLIFYSYVPNSFCVSYTVPLLKVKDFLAKSLECSDFRGIAISNIISKCFEYCLLRKFSGHFNTSDQPFWF